MYFWNWFFITYFFFSASWMMMKIYTVLKTVNLQARKGKRTILGIMQNLSVRLVFLSFKKWKRFRLGSLKIMGDSPPVEGISIGDFLPPPQMLLLGDWRPPPLQEQHKRQTGDLQWNESHSSSITGNLLPDPLLSVKLIETVMQAYLRFILPVLHSPEVL